MGQEPGIKRAFVFVDGQNLYHSGPVDQGRFGVSL